MAVITSAKLSMNDLSSNHSPYSTFYDRIELLVSGGLSMFKVRDYLFTRWFLLDYKFYAINVGYFSSIRVNYKVHLYTFKFTLIKINMYELTPN